MTFFAILFVLSSAAMSLFALSLGAKAISSDSIELVGKDRLVIALFILFGISAGLNALFVLALMNT